MNTIRVYKRNALRAAFEAGRNSALADTTVWKEIFEAGEKHGSAYLNEACHAPGFFEYMKPRRQISPGSFDSWARMEEEKLAISIKCEDFDVLATESMLVKNSGKQLITLYAIEEVISEYFGINISDLRYVKSRADSVTTPRHFAYYFAYFHVHKKLIDFGEQWGGHDHATVYYGVKKIAQTAPLYKDVYDKLVYLYKRLDRKGYNIAHFVQDVDSISGLGGKRKMIKPVEITL